MGRILDYQPGDNDQLERLDTNKMSFFLPFLKYDPSHLPVVISTFLSVLPKMGSLALNVGECFIRLCPSSGYLTGHQSQSLSQSSNENWIASGVWPLMCVVSLTTLSMLTGHIRRSSISERVFWASRRGQSPEESTSEKVSPRRAGKLEILHLAYILRRLATILERGFGKLLKGTIDYCDFLSLFRRP